MPAISRFYGIIIKMYFREHGIPHFHAVYGEFIGVYDINGISMMEGDLPARAHHLVIEWTKLHQAELLEMWKTQNFHQIAGLE